MTEVWPGSFVIGTAGHVDHGKSTLVQALTGVDPDRLPEEKRRGMTIELGFAPLRLPSGRIASIVDVPGHERFVSTVVAGASAIDAALVVVAADEGIMPQTYEHLAILDLLNVTVGVVAVNKMDLVDAELLEMVREEATQLVTDFRMAATVVSVSSVTGEGLPELREALDAVAVRDRERDSLPVLPIDRVFTVKGFGTVVTGTLSGGVLTRGAEVEVAPSGRVARIRGIQVHRESQAQAEPGSRVALNLSGIDRDAVRRGGVVTLPRRLRGVKSFDARLRILPDSPIELTPSLRVSVHAGTDHAQARISPLYKETIEPGESAWARLRLDTPLVVWRRQNLILRLPSPAGTIGGGTVVDVAPERGHAAESASLLEGLLSEDLEVAVLALIDGRPRDIEPICRRTSSMREPIKSLLQELEAKGRAVRLGDVYLTPARLENLRGRALEEVEGYHRRFPLRRAMPVEELRQSLHLTRSAFENLISLMTSNGDLVPSSAGDDGKMHLPSVTAPGVAALAHSVGWTGDSLDGESRQAAGVERFLEALEAAGFSPPPIADLSSEFGIDAEMLRHLREMGRVTRINDDIYLGARAHEEMVRVIGDLIQHDGSTTVARIRDVLESSRKYVLAFVEYLDGQHVTSRVGDVRVAGERLRASRV